MRRQVVQVKAVAKKEIITAELQSFVCFYQNNFAVEKTASQEWIFYVAKMKRLPLE